MSEAIVGALAKLTTESGRAIQSLRAWARAVSLRMRTEGPAWWRAGMERLGARKIADQPISNALVKLTAESSKVILALPERSRALVSRVPEPVQVELRKLSSRGAHVTREIFAGILVIGLVVIVLGYGRLARGPVSLTGLVSSIEEAINRELDGVSVKIDDAILQRAPDGPGVLFRLRNIRLVDADGAILAQAPLAAIGLSGSALLSGRLAPGSVDFIGPRLLLTHEPGRGLSLSFSRPSANGAEPALPDAEPALPDAAPPQAAAPSPETGVPESVIVKRQAERSGGGQVLDVTRTVAEVFERARKGDSSYLTRFGVQDALVVLNHSGTQTSWQVPDFSIDLEHHNARSVLVSQANIASAKGDWQLEMRAAEQTRRQSLAVTALIQNLVPSGIAGNFSSLGLLRALDMVVNGEASVELSNAGDFVSGSADFGLETGQITPPWDPDSPLRIDGGRVKVRYIEARDAIEIAPSTLNWGKSRATFSGLLRPERGPGGAPVAWNFDIKALPAVLAVEEFGLAPMKVDEWRATGSFIPHEGRLNLTRFVIRAGNASIALAGTAVDRDGAEDIRLAGEMSPMPVDVLKRFWPKFLAGKARAWVLERVSGGQVLGGKFAVNLGPAEIAALKAGGEVPAEAVNVDLKLSGMSIAYLTEMPPVVTSEATLTVSGTKFAVDIPQGKITAPSGRVIALSQGRFSIPDLRTDPQRGDIVFRAGGETPTVLELLDHEPLGYLQSVGMKPDFLGGTAEGGFSLSMPLLADLTFEQIKVNGQARLNDALTGNIAGNVDVAGGSLDVILTDQSLQAMGAISIKGVPAELSWQRVFRAPDAQQPPLQVTARLDAATREQLGLKVNHLVKGPTPVTLRVARLGGGDTPTAMALEADLTDAEILFGGLGWTKPAGRAATLQLDFVPQEDGSAVLDNLKILGDDIDIQGGIALDAAQHLKEFHFSDFSVNNLTHMQINAVVRDDQVLEITAEGPSYDGRQFFQSLFSAGQLEGSEEPDDPFGIDLTARIGTVVGFYNTTANNVEVTMKKRNGQVIALDARTELNGKAPAAVQLVQKEGARMVEAEARNAGDAFRLVGFYPSVEGGEASLQVNLDAGGPGTKSGTLWARDFVVLGDSVVSEVLTDPNSAAVLGPGTRKQQVTRQRIGFNQLRAPFSVGGGKFRLHDAYINGPLLGATMRGTVDFKAEMVELGGTYVPLYGLNSALGQIPLLGRVLVGREGEGVVGITFAIKGKLDDPAVLVNPMSVMTPGIFRQIFEFTGTVPDPNVKPETSSYMVPGAVPNQFGLPAQ
ncbi:MAG: AsmA-like C-terminal domain-containing protein [Methyloceanibacter sp.]